MSFNTRACSLVLLLLSSFCLNAGPVAAADAPHNLILFIPDGLRSGIVDAQTAPTFNRLREEGVYFANSHSLFPTFTTANASAFATGHQLGDTGDFSNYIYSGFAVQASGGTVTPFLETDPVLKEVNAHFDGNYLNEEAIVAAAHRSMSTALVGKLGPAAIFHLQAMNDGDAQRTLIIDDSTGSKDGVALPPLWLDAIAKAGLKPEAPGRGDNGKAGTNKTPGTWIPNLAQQQYFLEMTVKVILPQFKASQRPFVLVYWSRDPDGSQHNHGDSLGALSPGINGPTSLAAIRSADTALASIEQALKSLGLSESTNIVVAADHGFSTISKASATSPAARTNTAPDVNAGELPVGFLALDLATALKKSDKSLKLFDPDDGHAEVAPGAHPKRGNGVIGKSPTAPRVVVAANGGSDLVYIPDSVPRREARALARKIVSALVEQDYVSGVFVNTDRFGALPGALALKDIGLVGKAATPTPALVVNFASKVIEGCKRAVPLCTAVVADTTLQQGQGMHGSFSRSDTFNFMAARGPDFRKSFANPLPASNADVGATVAKLLGLNITPKGQLVGRVLNEALAATPDAESANVTKETLQSKPTATGLKTILERQRVGEHVYYTTAGFSGRTAGLEH
jgi:hypothetical protein